MLLFTTTERSEAPASTNADVSTNMSLPGREREEKLAAPVQQRETLFFKKSKALQGAAFNG